MTGLSETRYDVIILGKGLAGLFAGSLLLGRGLKVLSLSHGEGLVEHYSESAPLDHLSLKRQGFKRKVSLMPWKALGYLRSLHP